MAYSCLLRNPLSWLAVLGSLLAFSRSTNFWFLTILLTSSALILCPVIILRAKRCQKKSITREDLCGTSTEEVVLESSSQDKVSSVNQTSSSEEEELKKEKEDKTRDTYLVRSSVEALLSDSESVDHTTSSEDSEVDWMFRENLSNDSTNYSDGSISDEEGLIEIALPTGHYVDSQRAQEQQSWYGFQQKWTDCSLESHFRHQNWMEMLNEMNDDNFIEIDLCMGSIKCSRFEIQA
ncbi:uncharacterized protein LOC130806045 [Amaranthus tricolor]|uniref:uncharacterized protein LOC130806045 n=1 Tax=Amaranthus tricolor TaxID=29722 RepID=UPI002582D2AE|nr:uncharacterized protein LOC130806045 [Amaranthus tricolor]